MFGDFLKRASKSLGLGKQYGALSGLFQKARGLVNTGMNFIKSEPVRNLIGSISKAHPTAGQFFNDAKKYGSIVSNLMNGGLEKKIDRFIQQNNKPSAPTIERVPKVQFRRPGMFDAQPQPQM